MSLAVRIMRQAELFIYISLIVKILFWMPFPMLVDIGMSAEKPDH